MVKLQVIGPCKSFNNRLQKNPAEPGHLQKCSFEESTVDSALSPTSRKSLSCSFQGSSCTVLVDTELLASASAIFQQPADSRQNEILVWGQRWMLSIRFYIGPEHNQVHSVLF